MPVKTSMSAERDEPRVRCRRLGVARAVYEHRGCPYCFGAEAEIATGAHERFCDFEPGVDPIVFGFPATHGRHLTE